MVDSDNENETSSSIRYLERGSLMMHKERYKIVIRCLICGEKYILRGHLKENGEFETGFKRCVCDNDQQLHTDATLE